MFGIGEGREKNGLIIHRLMEGQIRYIKYPDYCNEKRN